MVEQSGQAEATATAQRAGIKRKRSVIACAACHQRKVRCNVAIQGAPCSNCDQDGQRCEIYRRKIGIPGQGPLKSRSYSDVIHRSPTEADGSNQERNYPLTPSPASASTSTTAPPPPSNHHRTSSITNGGIISQEIAQTTTPIDRSIQARLHDHHENTQTPQPEYEHVHRPVAALQTKRSGSAGSGSGPPAVDVEPYFAGESEGLEFLFDQCAPDRPVKGVHYVTPKKTYRTKRPTTGRHARVPDLAIPLPPRAVQQELVRCFCYHQYPAMPVIRLGEFLSDFEKSLEGTGQVKSPLLLWSVFFAALSFIDKDILRAHRLAPKKILKQQYYQNAKDIYNSDIEADKTNLMSACLLLASNYQDLEDRDGSWYWIGTAISLAHTVGLHRHSNYGSMPNPPFSSSMRLLWRRIWWCIFYREAWLGQGFGRPMRLCIDDCDEDYPTADEVLEEVSNIEPRLTERYLPPGLSSILDGWIVLVQTSIEVAEILRHYYRPRSPLPTPYDLRNQEERILELRAQVPRTGFSTPNIVLIHICHLEMYFNGVLILLYRPLMAKRAREIGDTEYLACRTECIGKARAAANDTTNMLNKLMSLGAIDQSPSMLISAIMGAMQILVFDMRGTREKLGKSYAAHQLDLHLLVLGHLKKTYWTADLQHNLYIEVLKVLNGGENNHQTRTPANERALDDGSQHPQQGLGVDPHLNGGAGSDPFVPGHALAATASLDDFFGMFNPFMGLPGYCDDLSASVEWDLSPPNPLTIQSLTGRID